MSTDRNALKRKSPPAGLSDAPAARRNRCDSECEYEDDFAFESEEEEEPEHPEPTASEGEWLVWWARIDKLERKRKGRLRQEFEQYAARLRRVTGERKTFDPLAGLPDWRRVVKVCGRPEPDRLWQRARVAVQTPDEKYVVVSPNMLYVPLPPHGEISVTIKQDGRYGMHDPTLWPQIFVPKPEYWWLPCVPRCPDSQLGDEGIWELCDTDHFERHAPGFVTSLGVVPAAVISGLRPVIDKLAAVVADFETRQPEYGRSLHWLMVSLRDCFSRLAFPATRRDLRRQCGMVFRLYVMCRGFLVWHDGVWKNTSNAVAATNNKLMGAFTTNVNVVQRFHRAGIPVWWLRGPSTFSSADVVERYPAKFVAPEEIQYPEPLFSDSPIYHGMAGEHHLSALAARANSYIDVEHTPMPANAGLGWALPSWAQQKPSGVGVFAPVAKALALAQVKKGAKKPAPSNTQERDKFAFLEHRWNPDAYGPCLEALRSTNRHGAVPTSSDVWGYWTPEPGLVIGSPDGDRAKRYIWNWLQVKDAWLYLLQNPNTRRSLPTSVWRVFLNAGPSGLGSDEALGRNGAKRTQFKHAVRDSLTALFGGDLQASESSVVRWRGEDVSEDGLTDAVCRQVAWELYELGWRMELFQLDVELVRRTSSPEARERLEWYKAAIGDETPFSVSNPKSPGGMHEGKPGARLTALQALRKLMLKWPNVPPWLQTMEGVLKSMSLADVERVQSKMLGFYCQTFYERSGRAPILPYAVPV